MEDEKLEREPSAEEQEENSDEVEAKELGEEELDEAAGGDPGLTHPDTQAPYIP